MSRDTRLSRLVGLARRREEQARQRVATARTTERTAREHVAAGEEALRRQAAANTDFRLQRQLLDQGRGALGRAEDGVDRAVAALDAEVDVWRSTHQRLQTLERLDTRLQEAMVAEQRRREQQQNDELAGSGRREAQR